MKKTYNDKLPVTVLAFFGGVSGIGAAVTYLLSYLNGLYEYDIHHFKTGELLPILTAVLIGVAVALTVSAGIVTLRRDAVCKDEPVGVSFALYLVAFMFLAYFVLSLKTPAGDNDGMVLGVWCARLSPYVGLLSSVPLVCAASSSLRRNKLHRIVSMLPTVWCMLIMFKYYFDQKDFALNDPELMVTNVCLASAILFMTAEARRALVIDTSKKNVMASFIAAFITLPLSAVRLYLVISDKITVPEMSENMVLVAIGVLGLFRLITVVGEMKAERGDYVCLEDRTAEAK